MKGMILVAIIAMLGSLFYSEIAGYEPCKLCWYQRIFMYPQVFLMALAIAWRTEAIARACGILSGIGALIAGYHYLLQVGVVRGVECGAIGYSAACSQRFVMNYGYITIPLMALSAFLLIMILAILRYRLR
ncbi:disulfide bond formation protein B [Candidatus Uhrbacteria bacterium]|nr:disulfide bond formation protein B [Candidatus Uhrbacteria bacterium]